MVFYSPYTQISKQACLVRSEARMILPSSSLSLKGRRKLPMGSVSKVNLDNGFCLALGLQHDEYTYRFIMKHLSAMTSANLLFTTIKPPYPFENLHSAYQHQWLETSRLADWDKGDLDYDKAAILVYTLIQPIFPIGIPQTALDFLDNQYSAESRNKSSRSAVLIIISTVIFCKNATKEIKKKLLGCVGKPTDKISTNNFECPVRNNLFFIQFYLYPEQSIYEESEPNRMNKNAHDAAKRKEVTKLSRYLENKEDYQHYLGDLVKELIAVIKLTIKAEKQNLKVTVGMKLYFVYQLKNKDE
uniref:Uncharacterized protein n=1 Tax=Timema bartmani TaxID=61472 RepID=A0A7R9EZJ0_9NEOP|nr:unnamed protein product [Timema bartmani]